VSRVLVVAALLVCGSACGASAASTTKRPMRIAFGLTGGNMIPFQVVVSANGAVRSGGSRSVSRKHLSRRTVLALDRRVRAGFRSGVKSRRCPNTLPDVGSDFIRLGQRTVTVHGGCEPRFRKLWNALAAAVGLRLG
jgi:hypothetical protein